MVPLSFKERFTVYFLGVDAFKGLKVDTFFAFRRWFRLFEYFFLFHSGLIDPRHMCEIAAIDIIKE